MTCAECGTTGPCEDLFHTVLALDHSRRPPWGPLHGVAVACYLLQHPSRLPATHRGRPRRLLDAYLAGGLPAVTALTESARRSNAHGGRGPAADPVPGPPPTTFAVTIGDVAVDGTFPAAGFETRVRAWATATLTAWDSR